MTLLEPGKKAPAFHLADQDGEKHRLSQFKGRKVLLYFYPRADTPGCTKQSCDVSEAREDFSSLGVDVLGISPDKPEKLKKFDEKYGLGFPLLSDPDHVAAEKFGAWGEKTMRGKTYMGIIRSSFLIDEQGKVMGAWYKVKPLDTVPKARALLEK